MPVLASRDPREEEGYPVYASPYPRVYPHVHPCTPWGIPACTPLYTLRYTHHGNTSWYTHHGNPSWYTRLPTDPCGIPASLPTRVVSPLCTPLLVYPPGYPSVHTCLPGWVEQGEWASQGGWNRENVPLWVGKRG